MSDFLSCKQVCARVGLSKWTIYRMIEANLFPPPTMYSKSTELRRGKMLFDEREVDQWMDDRLHQRGATPWQAKRLAREAARREQEAAEAQEELEWDRKHQLAAAPRHLRRLRPIA